MDPQFRSLARSQVPVIAILFIGSAAVAQDALPPEAIVYAEKSAEAVADRGLAVSIDLLDTAGERRAGSFKTVAEMTLDLRFQNVGNDEVRLFLDGPENRFSGLAPVIDVALSHDDGKPVERPECRLGTNFEPDGGIDSLLWSTPVQVLAPGGHAIRRVPMKQLNGVGQLALAPGVYRMRVTYRGIPEAAIESLGHRGSLASQAPTTWRGGAQSQELRFRVIGSPEPLEWSPSINGLRTAAFVDPTERRAFLGEEIRPRFLVENVSEKPLTFLRAVGASEDDRVSVTLSDGVELCNRRAMSTGWYPTLRWTLPPGCRVWIDAAPFHMTADGFSAWNQGGGGGSPGRYKVQYSLSLRDGRVRPNAEADPAKVPRQWNGELTAPSFEIEYLDRSAK